MANINVTWSNVSVDAPLGTVIDHADVDLLDNLGNVVMSQPGAAGTGLPATSMFVDVKPGTGYTVRLRNFDTAVQFGADVVTNAVDVIATTVSVTVVGSGAASVA